MNIGASIDILNKTHGMQIPAGYYRHIEEWRQWWAGHVKSFHRYREMGEHGQRRERELYSLKMAKKVCEDWAAAVLNERMQLSLADAAASEFLQGRGGEGGVLKELGFWSEANRLVEKAFYSGTGAFVLKMDGLNAVGGKVLKSPEAVLRMEYLPAFCIVPLSSCCGQVTEVAFVSERVVRGQQQVYMEEHLLEGGRYVIINRCFCKQSGQLVEQALPEGVAAKVDTGSPLPFFSIIRPNMLNPYPDNLGLGCAVFSQAVDCLKGVDLAFNNFVRDFKLGAKKVFYNRSLTASFGQDADGRPILLAPDDLMQQLFVSVGDEFTDDSKMIYEFNPDLRVQDNQDGVQAQLDYLSFKCGMGTKHYQFGGDTVVTATQYNGDRQEMRRNAAKHGTVINEAVQRMLRAMLWVGRYILGRDIDAETEMRLSMPDGYLTSDEDKRELDRRDVLDGILNKWEYRVKWYGEEAEQAKTRLEQAAEE